MREPSSKPKPVTAHAARRIIRLALTASLATVEPGSGAPFVSLVSVATAVDCTPIVLLSQLSHHTASIGADPRVSLLFDGTSELTDRLEGGRVTVSGTLIASPESTDKQRYMARHPRAFYADFADFGWYRLNIDRAVFVAGFGRVRKFSRTRLLLAADQCGALSKAQTGILSTVIGNPADDRPGAWQLAGVDPEGLDLVRNGTAARRDFPVVATTAKAALAQIDQMTELAAPGDPILDLASNRTGSPLA